MTRNKNTPTEPTSSIRSEFGNDDREWARLYLAWATALVGTLGVLFIGEVMGQAPCVMCWFQRAFMFPLAVILTVAALKSDFTVWKYVLPLSIFGVLFAFYHTLLYIGLITEKLAPCSQGVSCTSGDMVIFGLIPIPMLSLISFLSIAALAAFSQRRFSA